MTYDEALTYIHHSDWRKSRLGLSRIRTFLSLLGNPQKQLRFIHVAGTNGKGSTVAMLSSILRCAGYRTGMYISPCIDRFNEYIQLDGVPIPDDALARLTERVRPFADAMDDHPTEFELITAIAFSYFLEQGCDVVMLEVGMGGALDSTNVIDAPELAVLTNIGLDHVRELGPTIADIARTKAGIIKPGCTVVTYDQNEEADAVIAETCRAQSATLVRVDHTRIGNLNASLDGLTFDFHPYQNLHCSLIGSYQPHNAAVALTAVEQLQQKGWRIGETAVRAGLACVAWPARFEILCRTPLLVADGGHNPQGVDAALESLRMHFPGQKPVFLLGMMADKDVSHMLEAICGMADQIVTVTPGNPRAMASDELAARARAFGGAARSCASVGIGLRTAMELAGPGGLVCALGSLYLLRDVRAALPDAIRPKSAPTAEP